MLPSGARIRFAFAYGNIYLVKSQLKRYIMKVLLYYLKSLE